MKPEQEEAAVTVNVVVDSSSDFKQLDIGVYEGSPAERVHASISKNGAVVFGKTWCPFCTEANRLLASLGVDFVVCNLDTAADGSTIHAALKEKYTQATVPYVFVGGALVGGCNALNKAHADGKLEPMLRAAGVPPRTSGKARKVMNLGVLDGKAPVPVTLFSFPEAVDERVVRLTSIWIFIISVLCAVFYDKKQAHFTMLGLAIDFVLRFIGGGNISPLGSLSACIIAVMELFGSKPQFCPGPPKQFAALCGIIFAATSTTFYLCAVYEKRLQWVGLAFSVILAVASGLVCFFGFCFCCVFFSLMIQFGLMPQNMYQLYTSIAPEVAYTYADLPTFALTGGEVKTVSAFKYLGSWITQSGGVEKEIGVRVGRALGVFASFDKIWASKKMQVQRTNDPEPARKTVHLIGKDTPLSIDYKYKTKTDDYTEEDFNLVKHVKIADFMMFLSLNGIAAAWYIASYHFTLYAPTAVAYAITLFSAFTYTIWVALYICKMVLYPQKVMKEWQCTLRSNSFVLPFTCLVIFAFLVADQNMIFGVQASATCLAIFAFLVADQYMIFARVLFWIGAPMGLLLSFIKVGGWLSVRRDMEHVNAAWMIMPVQNFVSAMVGPMLDPDYTWAMQFWFAFAFVMWLVLFALTFVKAVVAKPDDDRLRPLLAIWVAAPAVAAAAYLVCFVPMWRVYVVTDDVAGVLAGSFNDFLFINFVWFSVSLALCMAVGLHRPFFGRIKFDMSYWATGFPSAAVAIAVLFYYALIPGPLSQGIAIAALAVASVLNVVLLLQTYAGILRFKVFVPDNKWGPLSFMRLSHEAFRGALPKLVEAAKAVVASGTNADAALIEELSENWRTLSLAHTEHAKHEDLAIFKTYNEFFPGVVTQWNEEHEEHHKMIAQINTAVAAASSGSTPGALVPMIEEYAIEVEKHLRGEEDHLQGMPRKYLPLEIHKQILRECWALTPAPAWADFIPWALNALPMLHQRVRFLKTLLWAMPQRAQHIGIMVASGVDDVQWRRITRHPDRLKRYARIHLRG
ncbi:hypothetical protein FOA52_015157 [Chlamydomonas sp. UWO 241]|nr:hypothetical protein FOA52_015157 [Chlamydomonas sp. UWO 241]